MLPHRIRQLHRLAGNDMLRKILHRDRRPPSQAGGQDGTDEQSGKQNREGTRLHERLLAVPGE
jgi:hypothetical protein